MTVGPGTILSHFKILAKIGRGEMGEVFSKCLLGYAGQSNCNCLAHQRSLAPAAMEDTG